MNDTTISSTNPATEDILSKVRAGIEHVEETGESFDIEMTEEEYSLYKQSISSKQNIEESLPQKTEPEKNDAPVPIITVPAKSLLYKNNTVQSKLGESTYEILVREFDLANKIPRLGARYNALENILATIKVSPTLYGITSGDITKPNVGDTVNIEKIAGLLHDIVIAEKNIIDHANGLPDVVVSGIEEYMPADAKNALLKVVANVIPLTDSVSVPILEDPTGEHSLESGLRDILLTGGGVAAEKNTLVDTSMTLEESKQITESLLAEMKLHNIPWQTVLSVGAEPVQLFSSTDHSDPMIQRIASLVKIHQVKTDVSMEKTTTVLEYLQQTVLFLQRKA